MSYITQSHYLLRIAECIESGLDGEGVSAESREFYLERLRKTLESCRLAYPTSVYSGHIDAQIAMEAARGQRQQSELASKVCLRQYSLVGRPALKH